MDLEKRVVGFIWLEMRRGEGGGEHSPKAEIWFCAQVWCKDWSPVPLKWGVGIERIAGRGLGCLAAELAQNGAESKD